MLAKICLSCRMGGVHDLPVLTIFYPVAGKRTGTISHAGSDISEVTSDGRGEIENVKNDRPSDVQVHLPQQMLPLKCPSSKFLPGTTPLITLVNVNASVHRRILKKNKVTWSNCTAARSTLPYILCTYLKSPQSSCKSRKWWVMWGLKMSTVHHFDDTTMRLPSQTNDVRMSALSVRMS